jgi:CBS domain-containing protein
MLCSEIMENDVKVVRPNDDIAKAASMMRDLEVVFLPVYDSENARLVGTLTDRDIAIRLVAERKPLKTKVSEVMSKEPVFCPDTDEVDEARDLMESHQVSWMIILDENEQIAGVISLSDLDSPGNTLEENQTSVVFAQFVNYC